MLGLFYVFPLLYLPAVVGPSAPCAGLSSEAVAEVHLPPLILLLQVQVLQGASPLLGHPFPRAARARVLAGCPLASLPACFPPAVCVTRAGSSSLKLVRGSRLLLLFPQTRARQPPVCEGLLGSDSVLTVAENKAYAEEGFIPVSLGFLLCCVFEGAPGKREWKAVGALCLQSVENAFSL